MTLTMKNKNLSGDIYGGLAAMLVSLPSSIAYGLVIYAAIGPEFAGAGAMAGVAGAVAVGLIASIFGGTSRLISAPCAPAAAVLVVFVEEIIRKGAAPATVPLLMAVVVLMAGLVQIAAGSAKGGRIIKYIPFPVVTGYLSGVGVLIFTAQFPRFLGLPGGSHFFDCFSRLGEVSWESIVVGSIAIGAMLAAGRFLKKAPAVILALGAGALAYFVLSIHNPLLRSLSDNPMIIGPLPGGAGGVIGNALNHWAGVAAVPSLLWWELIVPAFTLAVLLSIDTLKTCVVLGAVTRGVHDSNRELMGQGLGNAAAALVCGIPGAGTMGATMINVSSGANTRASGVLEGAFALLALLILGPAIAWIPIAALAGILLVVGIRMVDPKTFKLLRHKSTWIDFAVILAVVAAAVTLSLIWAAAVGIALSISLFLRDQIRQPVVRRAFTGAQVFSKKKRVPAHMGILEERGAATRLFELQGQLFFGTTDALMHEIKGHLEGAGYVILDMRRVQTIDYTAVYVLHQIRRRIDEAGGTLAFAAVPVASRAGGNLRHYLADLGFAAGRGNVRFFDSVDAALTWAEESILKTYGAAAEEEKPLDLEEIALFEGLDAAPLDILRKAVRERICGAGERIFAREDEGDEIFFIRQGNVRVVLPVSEGVVHHLATFGRGDSFGDMAFLDCKRRSADALADEETKLFTLSRTDFEQLARNQPAVAALVFERLARMLVHRMRHTNIELEALEKA